jgi:hypothetical protein
MGKTDRHPSDKEILNLYGLFPPVAYFQWALNTQKVALFTHQESAFYAIGGANQIDLLRIPITASTKNREPQYWEISYQHKWVREHQNALKTAYGKSPFFEFYDYQIFELLNQNIPSFQELQKLLMLRIIPWLGLEELEITNLDAKNSIHFLRTLKHTSCQEYYQVFENKFGHRKELSILDLLFNIGPESASYFRQ